MEKTNIEGYRGPYLKRNGEDYRVMVEQLGAPPERPLSDDQKIEARAFEAELFNHEIEPGVTVEDVMRGYKDEDVVAPQVFAEAFLQNQIDVAGLPAGVELPTFMTHEQVYAWFAARANDKAVGEDTLLAMAQDTKKLPPTACRIVTVSLRKWRTIKLLC